MESVSNRSSKKTSDGKDMRMYGLYIRVHTARIGVLVYCKYASTWLLILLFMHRINMVFS